MPKPRRVSRRTALSLGAGAAALPWFHIRTAGAAGKLNIGLVDHWVPNSNERIKQQIVDWAEKNKVEVNVDRITTVGAKLQLTGTAESQASTGHDMMTFLAWDAHANADHLSPMDDVMSRLEAKYGPQNEVCQYLGKSGASEGSGGVPEGRVYVRDRPGDDAGFGRYRRGDHASVWGRAGQREGRHRH